MFQEFVMYNFHSNLLLGSTFSNLNKIFYLIFNSWMMFHFHRSMNFKSSFHRFKFKKTFVTFVFTYHQFFLIILKLLVSCFTKRKQLLFSFSRRNSRSNISFTKLMRSTTKCLQLFDMLNGIKSHKKSNWNYSSSSDSSLC